jgi:sulfur reductase FeS subunit
MARYGMVIDLNTCYGCQSCMAACSVENSTPFWIDQKDGGKWRVKIESKEAGDFPDAVRFFAQGRCMHCDEAPCESVCPTNATYTDKNGTVLVNHEACIGCFACMSACPYDARYVYSSEDVEKAKDYFGEFAKHKVPHVDKCSLCAHRLEEGANPACSTTCIGNAIKFGDLNDKSSEIYKLVSTGKAKALLEHLGTKPKVFYIS